jgi:hypothetical protein
MTNKYKLSPNDIKPIINPMGSCIASNRITVDGSRVGYMYREVPSDEVDSGWRFMAGDESDEYSAHAGNFAVYDVNTIANYDSSIIAFLTHAAPCAFARDGASNEFKSVKAPEF